MSYIFGTNRAKTIIQLASSRRVDIALMRNSHGLQGGHGVDQALVAALIGAGFQPYATGWMSALEGDGTGAGGGVGYTASAGNNWQQAVLSTVKNAYYAGANTAPNALKDKLNQFNTPNCRTGAIGWSPLHYLWIPTGAVNCQMGQIHRGTTPLGAVTDDFTFHVTTGQYGAGGGSTTMRVRRSDTPFTAVSDQAVNFSTGTQGDVTDVAITVAASAGRAGWQGLDLLYGIPNVTGPAMIYGGRIERTSRTAGFSVHAAYCAGSRSARDMYNWASLMPSTTLHFLFDRFTELQNVAKSERYLIWLIAEGHNMAAETLTGGEPPVPGTATHYDNYAYYMAGIRSIIRQGWIAWGGDPDKLSFLDHVDHPRNDANEAAFSVGYRRAVHGGTTSDRAANDRTYVAIEHIRPLATMVSAGDFDGADTVHLTQSGYTNVMTDLVNAVLGHTEGTVHEPIGLRGSPNNSGITWQTWRPFDEALDYAAHENVLPIIRVQVGPTSTIAQLVDSYRTAAIAQHAEEHALPLFIQNLSNARYGIYGTISGGLDGLSSPSPHTPSPSAASLFSANGVAAVRAFASQLFAAIEMERIANGFLAPTRYINDDEETWGVKSGSWTAAKVVGRDGGGAVSMWAPSVNDARASNTSHLISMSKTLGELEAERSSRSVTFDDTKGEFAADNHAFWLWFHEHNAAHTPMYKAVYEPAIDVWPEILCSHWNDAVAGASGTAKLFNGENPWQYHTTTASNFAGDRHDFPVYGIDLGDTDHVTLRTSAPVNTHGDDSAYWRWFQQQRRAAVAAGGVSYPVEVWLPASGSVSASGASVYEPTAEDLAWYAVWANSTYGDSHFNLWEDGASTQSQTDAWRSDFFTIVEGGHLKVPPKRASRLLLARF